MLYTILGYLVLKLNALQILLWITFSISLLITIVLIAVVGEMSKSEREQSVRCGKYIKQSIVVAVTTLLLAFFMPSTEQAMILIGVGGTAEVVEALLTK